MRLGIMKIIQLLQQEAVYKVVKSESFREKMAFSVLLQSLLLWLNFEGVLCAVDESLPLNYLPTPAKLRELERGQLRLATLHW